MVHIISIPVLFLAGFALGRIKNAKKLAAAQAVLDKMQAATAAEVKKVL